MCACTKPYGTDLYEYVILYVDNVLCISNKPREVISVIDKFFPMQPGLIEKPDMYLGVKVSEMVLPNGVIAWVCSASKYAQEACNNVNGYLEGDYNVRKFYRKVSTPL